MTEYNDMGVEVKTFTEFKPIEEGVYDFVIHGVVGLGLRKPFMDTDKKGKATIPTGAFKIIFELPGNIRDDGLTDVIGVNIFASTFGKSSLYRLYMACIGKEINDKYNENNKTWSMKTYYLSADGLRELLGKTGQLNIAHQESKTSGNTYSKVNCDSITSSHPKLPKPEPTREFLFFTPMQPDLDVFDKLTYWTQKEIMEAVNVTSFPTELHDHWVKIEEARVKEASGNEEKNTNKIHDTSAIE